MTSHKLSMVRSQFLFLLLIISYYGTLALAFPPRAGFTTSQPTVSTLAEPLPRATVIPWPSQVPISVPHIVVRATDSAPSASPTPTATGSSLGQVVIASTKQSTLPSAICGFIPYLNGTSSALGEWLRLNCVSVLCLLVTNR